MNPWTMTMFSQSRLVTVAASMISILIFDLWPGSISGHNELPYEDLNHALLKRYRSRQFLYESDVVHV